MGPEDRERGEEKLARESNENTSFDAERGDEFDQLEQGDEEDAGSTEEEDEDAKQKDDADEQEGDKEGENQDENRRALEELAKAADMLGKEESSQTQGLQEPPVTTSQHTNGKRQPDAAGGLKLYKTKMDTSSKKLLDSYATQLCGGQAGTYRFPDSIRVTYHPKGGDPTPIQVLQLDVKYNAAQDRSLDIRGFLPIPQLPEGVTMEKNKEYFYELTPAAEGEQLPLLTIADEASQALRDEQLKSSGSSKKRSRKSQGQVPEGGDSGKRARGEEEVPDPSGASGGGGSKLGSEDLGKGSRATVDRRRRSRQDGTGNREQQRVGRQEQEQQEQEQQQQRQEQERRQQQQQQQQQEKEQQKRQKQQQQQQQRQQTEEQQQQQQGKKKAAEVPKAGGSDWARLKWTLHEALRLLEADNAQMRRWWQWVAAPNSTAAEWCREVLDTWDIHNEAEREDLRIFFTVQDEELLAMPSSAEELQPPMPLPPPVPVPAADDLNATYRYLRNAVVALRDTHNLGRQDAQPLLRVLLLKTAGVEDVQHCFACVKEAWKNRDAGAMMWALLSVLPAPRANAQA